MKISLSVMLLAIVHLGCDAVSGQQTGSGVPPAAEFAPSKMPQAAPEAAAVEPKEPAAVFPHIKPVYRESNLRHIKAHCKKRGVRQINRDRVRLFIQPMGIVSQVIEVDLAHRELTVYPGTLSRKKIVRTPLDEQQTARIRALVTSDEFKTIPRENKKWGFDGTSYLVEVSIGDAYSWKLHWVPDSKDFMKVISHIQVLPKVLTQADAQQIAQQYLATQKLDWGQPIEVEATDESVFFSYKTPEAEMQLLGPRRVSVNRSTGAVSKLLRR